MQYQGQIILHLPDEFLERIREVIRDEIVKAHIDSAQKPIISEWLSRKEVSELLKVSLVTLNTWAKDGPDRGAVLLPRKIGGRIRYHRPDVLAAMKKIRKYSRSR